MHFCPECGQACYCHGDVDDHENELEADRCIHDCEEAEPLEDVEELA